MEPDELIEHFTLQPNELDLLANKADASKLGMTLLLKYFQHEARFPAHRHELPPSVVVCVAQQLELAPELWLQYAWSGRTFESLWVHSPTLASFAVNGVSWKDEQIYPQKP